MSKRKKAQEGAQPPVQRVPRFAPDFKEDLGWWYKTDRSTLGRIFELVSGVMHDSFQGIGKPELLKYIDSDTWSRRIDQEHRLIYRVLHDKVDFMNCRYHYL